MNLLEPGRCAGTVRTALSAAAFAGAFAAAPCAQAATLTDPSNDFLASFTGVHNGDLDIVSTFAVFDGTTFHIGGTMNGQIGTTSPSLYVFGINRGGGAAGFAAVGLTGVFFDTVITMTGAGVTAARNVTTNSPFVLPTGITRINGASFQIDVPLSALPASTGLAPAQYGFNLWTRDQNQAGTAALADFAPNNTTFVASAPEPTSIALIAAAVFGLGASRRRAITPN